MTIFQGAVLKARAVQQVSGKKTLGTLKHAVIHSIKFQSKYMEASFGKGTISIEESCY